MNQAIEAHENDETRPPVVYIAGAFRGDTAWIVSENIRAAERAGLEVARAGAMPLIPHANTAHFNGELTDAFWLAGTLQLLRRCDAIYVFNTAHLIRSVGTRGEWEEAGRLKIPRFIAVEEIAEWLRRAEAAQ